MSVNGSVAIDWGDGKHTFNVAKFEQAFELEQKSDAGLQELLQRLLDRKWRVTDLVEIHRLGLIGGGMEPVAALRLVRRYVEGRPWGESVPSARVILLASIVGVQGDNDVGKKQADQTLTEPGQPGLSDPQSTESAQQ